MEKLTEKQSIILALKKAGKTNPEIGSALGCSANVVRKQLTTIYKKLGISGGTPEVSKQRTTEFAKPEQAAVLVDAASDPFADITRAIKESGLPVSTGEAFLRRLRMRHGKVIQVSKDLKTQDLLRMLNQRIELALEYMDEKVISEASFRDLAMGTTAMIEKRALLRGEPTQILSDHERKRLHELLPIVIAEAQRRGLDIAGESRIISVEPDATQGAP